MPSGTSLRPKPRDLACCVPRSTDSERAIVAVAGVSRRARSSRSMPPELGMTNSVGMGEAGSRSVSTEATRAADSRNTVVSTERMKA